VAKAIRRVLEVNRQLPADRKIRVISISVGWAPSQAGYADVTAAVEEAEAAGIFVIYSSLEHFKPALRFHGLGRPPLADPDDPAARDPGFEILRKPGASHDILLVPMDSRTTASPTGPSDYVFYSQGGWSWCIPYIAGLYALACQVDPDMTPERFWAEALRTARSNPRIFEGRSGKLDHIVDPVALIKALTAN